MKHPQTSKARRVSWQARQLKPVAWASSLALLTGAGTTWLVLNSHFLSLDAGLCAALTLALCGFLLGQQAQAEGRHEAAAPAWVVAEIPRLQQQPGNHA